MPKDPSDALPENDDFMPRLWAYLTVKQILDDFMPRLWAYLTVKQILERQ